MVKKKSKPIKEAPKEAPKEEPKKEALNIEQLVNGITQNVVNILKPDMEKKIESLSQQIATEMQDIRRNIPQPQTYEPQTVESLPQQPTENPQQPQSNIVEQLLPLVAHLIKPAPANPQQAELMNVFIQSMVRNQLSKMNTADFIQEEMTKKMTKDMFGTTVPESVTNTNKHYMKPLRDVGNKAQIPDHVHGSEKP